METVARREWVIRELDEDGVVLEQLPEGGLTLFRREALPEDVREGDRFRVVARVDRRTSREEETAPDADAAGDPSAIGEALENLRFS